MGVPISVLKLRDARVCPPAAKLLALSAVQRLAIQPFPTVLMTEAQTLFPYHAPWYQPIAAVPSLRAWPPPGCGKGEDDSRPWRTGVLYHVVSIDKNVSVASVVFISLPFEFPFHLASLRAQVLAVLSPARDEHPEQISLEYTEKRRSKNLAIHHERRARKAYLVL
jgi:hypothetical protein